MITPDYSTPSRRPLSARPTPSFCSRSAGRAGLCLFPRLLTAIILCCLAAPATRAQRTETKPEATPSGETAEKNTESAAAESEIIELSPFVVNAEKDVGFVAATSLAGGRIASDIADTPVAYSVQTKEFLEALNLTDINDAFEWTVGATKYNDTQQAGIALGVDPLANATIRGVQANGPMRNFFNSSYNFDSYNVDRFDYMRGPNSILFGAGTIGGSANTNTKFAMIGRTSNEVRLQSDSNASFRVSVDSNESLGPRAAVRVNMVNDDGYTWRDGELKKKQGIAPALTFRLTPTTELKVSGEYGRDFLRTMVSPLRDNLSGWDGTYFALQPLTGSSTTQSTYNIHGVSRVGSSTAPTLYIYSPDQSRILNYAGTVTTLGYNANMRPINGQVATSGNLGLSGAGILDLPDDLPASLDVLYGPAINSGHFIVPSRDFTNLGTAPVGTDIYKDLTVILQQRLGNSIFLELAGNANRRHNYGNTSYWYSDIVSGFGAVYLDVNKNTPTGEANPYVGEPYQQAGAGRRYQDYDYKGAHLAAAYVKPTRWVELKLNAMIGVDRDSSLTVRELGVLPIDPDSRVWGLNNARSYPVRYRYYFNGGAKGEPPIGVPISVIDPQTGLNTTMTPVWTLSTSRSEGGVMQQMKDTNYGQAAAQLSFFHKRLILLGAIREDRLTVGQKLGIRAMDYPSGWMINKDHYQWRPDAPANWTELPGSRPLDGNGVPLASSVGKSYQNDFNPPPKTLTANTKSVGGVLNVIGGFQLTGNYAQTFNPPNIAVVTIDYATPPPSTSKGYDYGVRYIVPGGRLMASVSRYSSKTDNSSGTQPPGYTNFNVLLSTRALANDTANAINNRGVGLLPSPNWVDVENLKARGTEVEVVANLTKQWRLTFNYGTADATRNNAFQNTRAWLAENDATLRQILTDAGVTFNGNTAIVPTNTPVSSNAAAGANAWNNMMAQAANWVSGTQILQYTTKYTANLYTDYTIPEGRLKGLRLGVGYQRRGASVIGYYGADTIPNPTNPTQAIDNPNLSAYDPVLTKPYNLYTLTVAYPVKFGKTTVEFNLTVSNVFDFDDPIYSQSGLRAYQGNVASPARETVPIAAGYVEPRTFRLSATCRF